MDIITPLTTPSFSIRHKKRLQIFQQIFFWAEMTHVIVTSACGVGNPVFHFRTVEPVERISFNENGIDVFPTEDLIKHVFDRRGSST